MDDVLVIERDPAFADALIARAELSERARHVDPTDAPAAEAAALVVLDLGPAGSRFPRGFGRLGRVARGVIGYATEETSALRDAASSGATIVMLASKAAGPSGVLVAAVAHAAGCATRSSGTEDLKRAVATELARECGLTPAEAAVLRLVGVGASKDEIAGERRVAERTVKGHLDHIFDKVGRRVGGRSQPAIETWVLDEALYRASLRLDRK